MRQTKPGPVWRTACGAGLSLAAHLALGTVLLAWGGPGLFSAGSPEMDITLEPVAPPAKIAEPEPGPRPPAQAAPPTPTPLEPAKAELPPPTPAPAAPPPVTPHPVEAHKPVVRKAAIGQAATPVSASVSSPVTEGATEPTVSTSNVTNPATASAGGADGASMTAYLLQIRRQIERARPLRVDAAGQTRLTFSLAPDGALRDVTIAESSGNPELDRLAVQKLHNAAPFPPAPEGATDEQLLLSIPIRFE